MAARHDAMVRFCKEFAATWGRFDAWGHPCELGHRFTQHILPELREQFNSGRGPSGRMPLLATLVCLSAFDIAVHDAYGDCTTCRCTTRTTAIG